MKRKDLEKANILANKIGGLLGCAESIRNGCNFVDLDKNVKKKIISVLKKEANKKELELANL